MTQNNKVNIENSSKFIFDKLIETFHELIYDFKMMRLKNKVLKKSNLLLADGKTKLLIKKNIF